MELELHTILGVRQQHMPQVVLMVEQQEQQTQEMVEVEDFKTTQVPRVAQA